jgi:hypothetical protein
MVFILLGHIGSANAFEFKGFADVSYSKSSEDGADQGAFALGAVDFYLAQQIDDRTDVLVEFVIESDDAGEFVVDLERLQLGYIFSDALKLRAGRFHTVLGYWNTAYHHGTQLQTAATRPSFLEFEDDGGILPVHIIGLWASGGVKAAPAEIDYSLMLGNGSKVQDGALNPNNISDDTDNKAVVFRVTAEPKSVEGLGIGVSGSVASVSGYAGSVESMRVSQNIYGLDVTYFAKGIEVLGEYYIINNDDDIGGGSYSSSAYYVQAGYTIAGRYTPYARYESVSIDDDGDPYFQTLGTIDSTTTTAGLRYNLNLMSSLKAEVNMVDPEGSDSFNVVTLQWAFTF